MIVSLTKVILDRLQRLVSAALQTDSGVVWLLHPPLGLLSWAFGHARGAIYAIFTHNYLAWLQLVLPSGWITIRGYQIPDDPAVAYERAELRFKSSSYGRALESRAGHAGMPQSFGHQVAGHVKDGLVTLPAIEGVVLKPRLKEKCFHNEITFYESVFSSAPSRQPPPRQHRCSFMALSAEPFKAEHIGDDALDGDDTFLTSRGSNDEDGFPSGQGSPESASRGGGMTELSQDKNIFLDNVSYGAFYPMQFIPPYYGITTCGSRPHLVLGDLTKGFVRPCVLDLKIGQQTYEPASSLEVIEHHRNKYPYQEEIGFRITGFKVYDKQFGTYASVAKGFGRNLTPENVKLGLAAFFLESFSDCYGREDVSPSRVRVRKDVVAAAIERLEVLLRWVKGQNRYMFYCTSLLIIYEGDEHLHSRLRSVYQSAAVEAMNYKLTAAAKSSADGMTPHRLKSIAQSRDGNHSGSLEKEKPLTSPSTARPNSGYMSAEDFVEGIHLPASSSVARVDVRMIDFAHTLPCSPNSSSVDAGYRFGIASLLACLGEVLSIVDDDPAFVEHLSEVLGRCEKYISYNYARIK